MKIHRVGTLTLGITLIVMGVLFLVQLFFTAMIPIEIVIQAWPIVFILLGIEILCANRKTEQQEFVYDKIAIMLTMILIFFAMVLAIIGNAVRLSI